MNKKNALRLLPLLILGFIFTFASSCSKEDATEDDGMNSDGTVTDIDGNVYHTVTLGSQVWMVESLKATKYRNGDPIANITTFSWATLTTGAFCNYNNTASNATTYGRLYNWYAVTDSRKIAPVGWHVASDAEYETLITYLIEHGYGYNGMGYNIAKSMASTSGWNGADAPDSPDTPGYNQQGNNRSGFAAYPSGYRRQGNFGGWGNNFGWWSTTEFSADRAMGGGIGSAYGNVSRSDHPKNDGYAVRCVKN